MPRQARLDSPGTLHHVIIRGIEKKRIVDDSYDSANFVTRMGDLADETGTTVYAWSRMTNHAHILLKSGHLDLAEEVFRAHIRLLPQVSAAYIGLGDVYAEKGELPAAVENYESAMEIDPGAKWVAVIIRELDKND